MLNSKPHSLAKTATFLLVCVFLFSLVLFATNGAMAYSDSPNLSAGVLRDDGLRISLQPAQNPTNESSTTVTIPASIGGNVADADQDGIGDNHNALPGPVPGLISAGVDASGGPGSNGTMRMQFEWDISTIGKEVGVTSASVELYTFKGSIDSLDTYFYHGTAEQDGLLTDSDFEAPTDSVPGVVMPVTPGQDKFTFDVLTLLQSDHENERQFFSIQGRVDESLTGGGYKRGLQVWSTATSHTSDLFPQLIVTYVPCYRLHLTHSGSGNDPTASPTSSAGCRNGYYQAGESIIMTPHPDDNHFLDHWTGTDSADSNHLTMPANEHTVTAHYAPICYELILSHTGEGSDPTASPTHSSGCASSWYHVGEAIELTPHPAANHHLDYWIGTDGAESNQLTMPASNHTAIAHYEPTCYELTADYTGQGSEPSASPTQSSGCDSGWYHVGEAITMTAHPAANYRLDYWTGTDSAMSGQLTMPAGDHTVTAHYVPICYELTTSYTGQGSEPTASPTHSTGCESGSYHMGEAIMMSAHPADNYHLDHWTGTDSPSSNQLSMPGSAHTVIAHYVEDIVCYTLTRTHTGSGADPVASPVKSSGCDLADHYTAGETITVLANPSEDWQVANWSGTDNDSSTLVNNTLTMPAGNHTVAINYERIMQYLYLPHISYDGSN